MEHLPDQHVLEQGKNTFCQLSKEHSCKQLVGCLFSIALQLSLISLNDI